MQTIATLVTLAVLGVVIYDFAIQYAKAATTGWQRIWDAWSGGAADLKKQAGIVAAGVIGFSTSIVDWACSLLNDPTAAESIKSVLTAYVSPAAVGTAVAALTLITVLAKLQKLRKG